MAFLGFGKKDKVIDLGEKYRQNKELETSGDTFSLQDSATNSDDSPEENRKKLAKRLLDITKKLDEISTQIYHLQQRVELLERKTGIRSA